jgi:hypothetical protein
MRNFYFLFVGLVISISLFSCKKDGKGTDNPVPDTQQNLLVGKWTLQQEHFTRLVDNVKQEDTTFNTSTNNTAAIQFNKDGTFASADSYYSSGTANQGPYTGGGTSSGNYTFVGSTFGLSNSIAGLRNGVDFFGGTITSGTVPVITPVSNTAQISLLTSSKLNIHTESVYTYAANGATQTYKMTDDYYYSK